MYDSYTFTSFRTLLKTAIENYEFDGDLRMPEDWCDYRLFVRDVGVRPEGMSLGRIDRLLPHSKENTRWMTPGQAAGKKPYVDPTPVSGKVSEVGLVW